MKVASVEQHKDKSYESLAEHISTLLPTMSEIQEIALGWTDTLLFDRAFVDSKLKDKPVKKPTQSEEALLDVSSLENVSAEQLLNTLLLNGTPAELNASILGLENSPQAALLRDDYWQTSEPDLGQCLVNSFTPDKFNIVIIGAGPIGTLLSSGLKRELGDAIDILLVESRVSREHLKKPYSRRWMSNIPMKLFERLVHPAVAAACARTGDGTYMGVDICSLETLSLLSARDAGVRCLFTTAEPRQWLRESSVHLLIDASGGRWRAAQESEQKIFKGLKLKKAQARSQGMLNFGLARAKEIPGNTIDVMHKNGWLYPLFNGKVIKQSLLKISVVPIELHEILLQWAQKNNQDNKFYVWAGRKHDDINQLLLLVNLTVKEHEALSKFMTADCKLVALRQWSGYKANLDPRLRELFHILYADVKAKNQITVSRPFLVSPKMLDPDGVNTREEGIPVLSIGDSFFSGNPKSGNGLGVHIRHIHLVGHHICDALK